MIYFIYQYIPRIKFKKKMSLFTPDEKLKKNIQHSKALGMNKPKIKFLEFLAKEIKITIKSKP